MGKRRKVLLGFVILLTLAALPLTAENSNDKDNYRFRINGNWWLDYPTGHFGLQSGNNYFDLKKDFGFNSNSTFTGRFDWRFAHKHHFLLDVSPASMSRSRTLTRTIDFEGETYDIGTQVKAQLKTLSFMPGYQYDFIRADGGYLGLEADFDLIDTETSLSSEASVNGEQAAKSSSSTFFAPIPLVGLTGRWYPMQSSNRLSVEGSVRGMYFFGYGNMLTARASLGAELVKGLVLRGGYQMGSRLSFHGTADELAIRTTHTGPTAGIEYSWGEAPAEKKHVSSNEPSNWHVDWVPMYLWFSGLHGYVGARGYVVPVNLGVDEVFSNLNIGLMSTLDVRRKRMGDFSDLVFINLSSKNQDTPLGDAFTGYNANAKTFFLDSELYGRLIENDHLAIDAMGGARIWHLNNSLDLYRAAQPPVEAGQTQDWVDPVLGARFRVDIAKGWFASLKGDAGGFGVGSQQTWQIYTGAGKEFKQKFSVFVGYRYLDVDYRSAGFLFDNHMNGLLAGFGRSAGSTS